MLIEIREKTEYTFGAGTPTARIIYEISLTKINYNELDLFYTLIKKYKYSVVTPHTETTPLTIELTLGTTSGDFQDEVLSYRRELMIIATDLVTSDVKVSFKRIPTVYESLKNRVNTLTVFLEKNPEGTVNLIYNEDNNLVSLKYLSYYIELNTEENKEIALSFFENANRLNCLSHLPNRVPVFRDFFLRLYEERFSTK